MGWPPPKVNTMRALGRATSLVVPFRSLGPITDQTQRTIAKCWANGRDLFVGDHVGVLFDVRHLPDNRWPPAAELRNHRGKLIGRNQTMSGMPWTDESGADIVVGSGAERPGTFRLATNPGGHEVARAYYRQDPAAPLLKRIWRGSVVIEFEQSATDRDRAFAVATAWIRCVCDDVE